MRPSSDYRPSSTYILTSTSRHRHVSILSNRGLESVGYLGRSHGAFYFIWCACNTGIDANRLAIDSGETRVDFAVMYPKRRPDKKKPTPTGPCLLCDSICKRPGILQQHVTVIHRQRLARKRLAGQPFDVGLALAFVVAELSCSADPQNDGVSHEYHSFLGELKNSRAGLEPLKPDAYIFLRQKLDEFCELQS